MGYIGGLMGYISIYISQKVAIYSLWTVCPCYIQYLPTTDTSWLKAFKYIMHF